MFDRLNGAGIEVVVLAQQEAKRLGQQFVDTEMLLLGLLGKPSPAITKVLGSAINIEDLRAKFAQAGEHGESSLAPRDIPLTLQVGKIIKDAWTVARETNHLRVGPEHLLIAIIDERPQCFTELVHWSGLNLQSIRTQLLDIIKVPERKANKPARDPEERTREFREMMLTEVINLTTYITDLPAALMMVVNIVGKSLQASRCIIVTVDERMTGMRYHEYFDRQYVKSCRELGWSVADSAVVAQSVSSRSPLKVSYHQADHVSNEIKDELEHIGAMSLFSVQIAEERDFYGCLFVQQCDLPRDWTIEECEWLKSLADNIVIGMKRRN